MTQGWNRGLQLLKHAVMTISLSFSSVSWAQNPTRPEVEANIDALLQLPEFQILKEEATRRGVRIWLFGGTSHSVAIRARNPKSAFPDTLSNVLTSLQDIDMVIDGDEEDASYFEQIASTKLGHSQIARMAWEFRLLYGRYKNKEPLLNSPTGAGNALSRHTDSASLGMIELTDPPAGEHRIRDLKDWRGPSQDFMEDVLAKQIRLYYSDTHMNSMGASAGMNPPVLEAMRFLSKALQHGLAISTDDFGKIKEIVSATDIKKVTAVEYPRRWLIRNAYKLFYSTQSLSATSALLAESGMDRVLRRLVHPADKGHRYYDLAQEIVALTNIKIAPPVAPTATTTKPKIMYFHTQDYRIYELNKFSTEGRLMTIDPAVLHTKPVKKWGVNIPVEVTQNAVKKTGIATPGTYNLVDPHATRLMWDGTEEFKIDYLEFYKIIKDNRDNRTANKPRVDFRIVERLRAQLLKGPRPGNIDLLMLEKLVREEEGEAKPDFSILREWYTTPETIGMREPKFEGTGDDLPNHVVLMHTLGWSDMVFTRPEGKDYFERALELATDPANEGRDEVTTILKDFYKSPVLGKLGKWRLLELLEIATPEDRPDLWQLFTERFVARVDPSILGKDYADGKLLLEKLVQRVEDLAIKVQKLDIAAKLVESLSTNPYMLAPPTSPTLPNSPLLTNANSATGNGTANPPGNGTGSGSTGGSTTTTPPTSAGTHSAQSFIPPAKPKSLPAPKLLRADLEALAQNRNPTGAAASLLLAASENILNDTIAEDYHKDELAIIYGRREEAVSVMDTLVRHKGKNPILVGEAGVGKTMVMELAAQLLYFDEIPVAKQFQSELKNAIVIQTSPGRISKLAKSNAPSAQAAAVEDYIDAVRAMEKHFTRKIILFIDEIHRFEAAQIEALKPYLDSSKGIMMVGASTDRELMMTLDRNEAFARRIHRIPVREFSKAETKVLLTDTVVPLFEKKYAGSQQPSVITQEAVDFVVDRALEYNPDVRRPEGPFKLLQDAVVRAHRNAGKSGFVLTDKEVSEFLVDALALPLDPTNLQTFTAGVKELRKKLLETVIEQDRVIDAMLALWTDIYFATEPKDSIKVLLAAGPTGSGKTFSAQEFARVALGDERRMLEIDCTKYSTGGLSLNSLLGAPNGVISSDKSKGALPEFLMGRGKGMNVIVLNEFDKAHPDLAKQLMEMIDTGKLQGGDGQTYFTGRSLVVITTNKGDDHIYPRDREEALSQQEIRERMDRISSDDIKQWFMEPPKNDMYDTSMSLPPSFLQRISDAVPVAPVSMEGALMVAMRRFVKVSEDMANAHKIKLKIHKDVFAHLVKATYVPENGVREVSRAIDRMISDAMKSIENDIVRGEVLEITIDNADPKKTQYRAAVLDAQGSERLAALSPAPAGKNHVENPLYDQSTREKLANLESELATRVFGQEDAIRLSARAIRSRQINLQLNRPTSLLFLGPTGIGKTELAKTIAQKVYGSDKRTVIFDMGAVKWEGDLNNIFGSAKGFVGSGTPPPFEQFLDFPEGGVIAFDEIGNMGGGNKKIKMDLLKRFYAMLEEGEWRNSHGKTYSLKKYMLVFTSNEGQELFNDLPNDDLRMSAWKGAKEKDTIRKILKESGWPEPLIGRMGEMVMFRPLLKKSRLEVAKKEIGRVIAGQMKQYKFANVTMDEQFYEQVAETFFSHAEGGRSIRKFVEGPLTDILGQMLIQALQKYPNLTQTNLTFGLSDSYQDLLSFNTNFPPKREVELTLVADTNGDVLNFSANLSKDAPKKRLVSEDELRLTAYHEAGHAVANKVALTGRVVSFVTIVGQGDYGGYARYDYVGMGRSPTYASVVANLAGLYAGGLAEAKARGNGDLSAGRSRDLEMANDLARRAIVSWGLSPKAHEMPLDAKGKVDMRSKIVQEEIAKLKAAGFKAAEATLSNEWGEVTAVAEALLSKQILKRSDLDQLLPSQAGLQSEDQHDGEDESQTVTAPVPGVAAQINGPSCADSFSI